MMRLYHCDDLYPNQVLTLSKGHTHYLCHVLRATLGCPLTVFNERDGEWKAHLSEVSKKTAMVTIENQLHPAIMGPDVSLLFAPIKHDPLTFLIEKATELGVRHFYPVKTERCNIGRVNEDRLQNNMLDAAQQCERFDIPTLYPLMPLNKVLSEWNTKVPIFVCQERGEAPSLLQALQILGPNAPVGFLIGPEGGFSGPEFAYLKSFSFIKNMSLGSRILRAETAALAAVACYQAIIGDWNCVRP